MGATALTSGAAVRSLEDVSNNGVDDSTEESYYSTVQYITVQYLAIDPFLPVSGPH